MKRCPNINRISFITIVAQEAAHFICVPQIEQSELMMGKRRRERDRGVSTKRSLQLVVNQTEKKCAIWPSITRWRRPFSVVKKRVGKDVNLAASQHLFWRRSAARRGEDRLRLPFEWVKMYRVEMFYLCGGYNITAQNWKNVNATTKSENRTAISSLPSSCVVRNAITLSISA